MKRDQLDAKLGDRIAFQDFSRLCEAPPYLRIFTADADVAALAFLISA
jgi:hypothetical protein